MTDKPKVYRHTDSIADWHSEQCDCSSCGATTGDSRSNARPAFDGDALVEKVSRAADQICEYLDRQTADRIKARDASPTKDAPRQTAIDPDNLLSAANGGLAHGVKDAAERDSIEYRRNAHLSEHLNELWKPDAPRRPTINGKSLS